VDAVEWFGSEIMPHLRRLLPGVVVRVVGHNAPAAVLALACSDIEVGSADILAPALESARVGIAPLRFGAGVKGKVTASLAHGLPMVVTRVAIEGTGAADGQEVLLASEPEAFARAVMHLHSDGALWERLSRQGRELVQRRFSVARAEATLRSVFQPLGTR
jgi:glycosyltransferase involved in cell wall biosynthesis